MGYLDFSGTFARSDLFAAELHPYEGSLEEVYLQLTTPTVVSGERVGMAGVADVGDPLESDGHRAWIEDQDIAGLPGQGKRGH